MPGRHRSTPEDEEKLRRPSRDGQPKRRALLVGVRYRDVKDDWPELVGSFSDVGMYRELLIGTYGYREEDITVMKDTDDEDPEDVRVPDHLRPTQANLLREFYNLVEGAAPGDQFTLTFSGHSDQQSTADVGEEDGKDEVLISSDGQRLVDNDLRKILVLPLPAGSYLTAFFDTCHSGTMLDLPHHHCNAIYVPWTSKGKRRTRAMLNPPVRLQAQQDRQDHLPAIATAFDSPVPSTSRNASAPAPIPAYEPPQSARRRLALDTKGSLPAALPHGPSHFLFLSEQPFDSPTSSVLCNGWCSYDEKHASAMQTVVSISSCSDAQESWEGPNGSMTAIICRHLKDQPNSSYKDLMSKVHSKLHENSLALHQWTLNEKKAGREVTGELNEFQTPELSSLFKLDLKETIHL